MTSPSTLARKAAKTKNPVEAKKLRVKAALLRRQARAKAAQGRNVIQSLHEKRQASFKQRQAVPRDQNTTGLLPAGRNKIYPGFKAELIKNAKAEVAQSPVHFAHNPTTGWAPVDPVAVLAENLRKLARGKSEQQAAEFGIALRAKLVDAKVTGKKEAEEANLATLKTVYETNRINVVCAFLSEMEGLASIGNGPLPKVVMVSGFTLARVIDALRDAGYSSEGKGGGIRSRQV